VDLKSITLLSDFGLKDASVAIAKGILMQHMPHVPIIDISHDVRPYHTGEAAYLLASAYKNFQPGSIHIALFNVFSDAVPKLTLSSHNAHYFLSPDNGVIPLALGGDPAQSWQCYDLRKPHTFIDWLHETGRVAAQLQKSEPGISLPTYKLNQSSNSYVPVESENTIICDVLHIDQYENVVTNITKAEFAALGKGRPFSIRFMQMEEITQISDDYADVKEGYKLCRFNSSGYLEICINRGKAASLFGLRLEGKNNNLKLYFE
jgi:S-adenosylmethionine hydrolase